MWIGDRLRGRGRDLRLGVGGGVADDRHEVGVQLAVHDAGVQFAAVAGDLAVGEVVGGAQGQLPRHELVEADGGVAFVERVDQAPVS